jgi:hypothetical protein
VGGWLEEPSIFAISDHPRGGRGFFFPRWHSWRQRDIALVLRWWVARCRQAVSDHPRGGTGLIFLAGIASCKWTLLARLVEFCRFAEECLRSRNGGR